MDAVNVEDAGWEAWNAARNRTRDERGSLKDRPREPRREARLNYDCYCELGLSILPFGLMLRSRL